MKIVVIGGSGLIGTKVVELLRRQGHNVLAGSRATGVNAVTGEGLAAAMVGTDVVVDVSNSPSFDDGPVMEFFEKGSRNLLAAEGAAGVGHHVALSVVGTERMQASGYFRAKLVQENLIKASGIPYTIVRATQFFEFVGAIADFSTQGETVRLPSAKLQPIVSDDVAAAVAEAAVGKPVNGTIEVAGPEAMGLDEIVRRYLRAKHDARQVTTDEKASYYGTPIDDRSLTPGESPRLGSTRFADWLSAAGAKG
jgi:uncharacterized protein YbjT (DUF2867 family)